MEHERAVDWAIVVAIVTSFVVVPVVIVARPPALPFRVAFVVLPLVPAIALAAVAVWYALHRR